MTTLDSFFQNETKNIIEKFFLEMNIISNVPSIIGFIGGSKRFGYNIDNSDIDLFYYTTMNPNKYRAMLKDNGFIENIPYTNFKGISTGWKQPKYNIHVVLIGQWEYFNKVADDHIRIRDFLRNNPYIIAFIRNLKFKKMNLKGSVIYKSLLKMAQMENY